MSQVELKPCPFCGGKANLLTVGRSWYRITADHEGFCILEEHESDCPQTDDQLALLVRDWNLRISSEVDQLKAENGSLRNEADQLHHECARFRKNYDRYCWLRDMHIGDDPESINLDSSNKSGLDAAIDSAMSKEP